MKFEIDIPEEKIQEAIDFIINSKTSRGGISYELQNIIRDVVKEKIKEKLEIDFPLKISEEINSFINKEIYSALILKIPGWAKRRIKEMLEDVRNKFEKKDIFERDKD